MNPKTTKSILGVSMCTAILALAQDGYAQDCWPSKMVLTIQKYGLDYGLKNNKKNKKNKKCVVIESTYQMEIDLNKDYPVEIPVGAIKVHEKDGSLSIRGENDTVNPASMTIEIKGSASGEGYHQFYITVDDVGTIDPIVKVVDNNKYKQALREALRAFSEDFDLENASIEVMMPAGE